MKKALLAAAAFALLLLPALKLNRHDGLDRAAPHGSFMENVKVVRRDAGELRWSLISLRTEISEDGGTARLEEVRVTLPGRGMTVRADSGVYGMETGALSLEENIEAATENFVFTTNRLSLDPATGEITTDDDVLIRGVGFNIEGKGLRALEDKVWLLGNVRAIFF